MVGGVLLSTLMAGPLVQAGTEPLAYTEQAFTHDGKHHVVMVPRGFRLELLTAKLDGPRLLTFAPNGDLFIGSRSGNVYRLPPPYNRPEVLIKLSDYPHSVAFRNNEILIARTDGLYHAPYRSGQKKLAPEAIKLLAALPGGGGHNSRSVAVGPDGRIYLSLGISGNCSDQYLDESYPFEQRRGGILALEEKESGAAWRPYGAGLRNPVGFGWHPVTGVMYATNNGPDHWGYDMPPEYFSRIDPGSFHGMPWFQYDGKIIRWDKCMERSPPRSIKEVSIPVATFPARNAPLGMVFVPDGGLEVSLEHDAIVALHGSWGTKPSGSFFGDSATRRPPKIVAVRFKDGEAQRVDDLIAGFQETGGERWARPAGVTLGPDGALYFTSDSEINGLFRLKKMQ